MIEIERLNKTYETGNKALKNINITIHDGEFVFIMGRSGCGKSTLMKLLLKEVEPTSGKIVVNDMDLVKMPRRYVPKYRRRLGVVFQDFRLLKDKTVYENVAFAQRVVGVPSRVIKESVPAMLRLVGLSSKYKSFPNQLSGGEQQRVAIARALINSPEILLADEPTGNLDAHNSMEIMKLLEEINSRGTTVVVVTHSQETVDRMKKRVITLDRGLVSGDQAEATKSDEDVKSDEEAEFHEEVEFDEEVELHEDADFDEDVEFDEEVELHEDADFDEDVEFREEAEFHEEVEFDEEAELDEGAELDKEIIIDDEIKGGNEHEN